MVFAYYNRLSARQKAIYRKSDAITAVKLQNFSACLPLIDHIQQQLTQAKRQDLEKSCNELLNYLSDLLAAPALRVKVLSVRPHDDSGELHGLYEPVNGRKKACISVWMRTARRKQVVAFRSFMRTLLHEFCHHLDYEHFMLAESFHTEGFYKRETSLFQQLVVTA